MRSLLFFLVVVFLCVASGAARADAPADRPHSVFALVVTSNKSQKLTRPDLHYADDDGARYYELFRTVAPEGNIALLTVFDRDSAKLFPDLVAKAAPPEKARVLDAFARLTQGIREAKAKGEWTDFYFVFAGHGDVDEGRGFLELSDAKLVSDELTSLVGSVPATRSHVILDSCNSFFAINSRKPGGKRFATAAEAGERLNKTLPNVGVFLSTSAEAETFEWSELGAGIFSHAVRSGLSGAADANGDGEVSYDELAAFVSIAAREVKNPRYRPNVFARGPIGRGNEALLSLKGAAAARLRLPRSTGRVTLRDGAELPWIDAHLEAGADVSLYVPARIASRASIEIGAVRHGLERTDAGLVLAPRADEERLAARGAGDLFKSLFARPFGPRAFAQYKDEIASEPPPVYGVAGDDVTRMNELLRQAAENARDDRRLQALGFVGLSGVYAGYGLTFLDSDKFLSTQILGVASVPLIFAGWSLLRSSREESAYAWFGRERRRTGATTDLMVGAEARLFDLARRDAEERKAWRWLGIGYGTFAVATFAVGSVWLADSGQTSDAAGLAAFGFVAGVAFALPIIGTFSPTKTERLAELWARDPARARLEAKPRSSFSISPSFGGTSLGFSGTF